MGVISRAEQGCHQLAIVFLNLIFVAMIGGYSLESSVFGISGMFQTEIYGIF